MAFELTQKQAMDVGDQMGVDWNITDPAQFYLGMKTEYQEHAETMHKLLKTGDVTNAIGSIVLDHLKENPYYYAKRGQMSKRESRMLDLEEMYQRCNSKDA